MVHEVNDVELLYQQSKNLYDVIVREQADNIINKLKNAKEILQENWKGIDAGIQINDIVNVHNKLVEIRNTLANLAKDSSIVASNYREIQKIANVGLESLAAIQINDLSTLPEYVDNRDTIDIETDVLKGKQELDVAISNYDDFKNNVIKRYNEIMDNWQAGTGRDNANMAFHDFIDSAKEYKDTLANVSTSIANAIKNYQI